MCGGSSSHATISNQWPFVPVTSRALGHVSRVQSRHLRWPQSTGASGLGWRDLFLHQPEQGWRIRIHQILPAGRLSPSYLPEPIFYFGKLGNDTGEDICFLPPISIQVSDDSLPQVSSGEPSPPIVQVKGLLTQTPSHMNHTHELSHQHYPLLLNTFVGVGRTFISWQDCQFTEVGIKLCPYLWVRMVTATRHMVWGGGGRCLVPDLSLTSFVTWSKSQSSCYISASVKWRGSLHLCWVSMSVPEMVPMVMPPVAPARSREWGGASCPPHHCLELNICENQPRTVGTTL